MREVRKFLCWIFAISSLVCLRIALSSIVHMARRHYTVLPSRSLLIAAAFSVVAVIFGVAWWTVWREKASARGWGIAASLIHLLVAVWSVIHLPSFVWGPFWTTLALGVAGLVVFSRPYEQPGSTATVRADVPIPGDGTNEILNKFAGFLLYAVSFVIFFWWMEWLKTKAVPQSRRWPLTLLVLLVVLLITTLHELGHTATGLAFGMKLRAFVAGPFQWRTRDGKWVFQFKPENILSGGGATGVVPATSNFPRSRYLRMVMAGPLVNLVTGTLTLGVAFTAASDSPLQAGGFSALFGALSLALGACNLLPFRTRDNYSDGAAIYQLMAEGPWADYHRVVSVIGSSLVTPLRPRDYDIEAIQQAAQSITQGKQGLLLRLYAYMYFLDRGRNLEAGKMLKDAEPIYDQCASEIPAELHTVFVFGNAYARRDASAAREWWARMEAKKPTHFNVDYWMAYGALQWIEGHLKEANEACEKCSALAQQLPVAGAYEFDRYCCSRLRRVLEDITAAR